MADEERAEASEESDCNREEESGHRHEWVLGRRRTWYPWSSSLIIVIIGTSGGAPPACNADGKNKWRSGSVGTVRHVGLQ